MITDFKKLKKHHQKIFAFIIVIGIILFWRGIWGVADLLLSPNNLMMSNISSIIIGVVILGISHRIIKGLT